MSAPRQSVRLFSGIFLGLLLGPRIQAAVPASPEPAGITRQLDNALLVEIGSGSSSITIKDCPGGPCKSKAQQIQVEDAAVKADLKDVQAGDHVAVHLLEKSDKATLKDISVATKKIPQGEITWRLLLLAGIFFGFATLVSWGHPLCLTIIGVDNLYSNSKFQMALWGWVLLSTYLTGCWLRVQFGGWEFYKLGIPQNLVLLSGLSVITYAGAKGITTEKRKEEMAKAAAALPPGSPAPADPKWKAPGSESFFKDLFRNDQGDFDLGDFQMIVVTLVAIAMYLTLVYHFLGSFELRKAATLPDVDTTILAAFGLGQGAYLAKKAAGDVAKA